MTRPREFDEDEVLEKAMKAFWSKGYEATTMSDLMKVTGLNKGSIYLSFESKHSLFVAVLKRYVDSSYQMTKDIFSKANPRGSGVKDYLTEVAIDFAAGAEKRIGCFSLNTLVELAPHDDEIREILLMHKERYEALLATEISLGQKKNIYRSDISAGDLAATIDTAIFGIMADCKTGEARVRTKRTITSLIKMIEA